MGGRGDLVVFASYLGVCVFWSTIGDVRKCTDEEHITYSGGSKIKDLAQCGWEEKKDEKEKTKKILNCENMINYYKIKILKNHEN